MDLSDQRQESCFDMHMRFMQEGIDLIAKTKNYSELNALNMDPNIFENYITELTFYRSRCHNLSPEQEREFDSGFEQFVTKYRGFIRSLVSRN